MPSSTSQTASPARKGDRTALQILDAAEDLFGEYGFSGTTLRDVATRVGIQIPSLYNHFESKEALYSAVLERGMEPVLDVLSKLVAESGQRRPDVRAVVESIMSLLDERPHLPRLLVHETLAGGQRLSPVLRATIGPIFENAEKVTETSTHGTRWRGDQVPQLVLALYHIVVGNYVIAPLYEQVTSQDLMSQSAREKRTDFLIDLIETLFAPLSKN